MNEDRVFKALADPARRFLLDLIFERDGRTLADLESELDMTRFGVMKHLRVLEEAGLVVPRRSGREKLHFLNSVPIELIVSRWIGKFRVCHVSALTELKAMLERLSESIIDSGGVDSDPPHKLVPQVRNADASRNQVRDHGARRRGVLAHHQDELEGRRLSF